MDAMDLDFFDNAFFNDKLNTNNDFASGDYDLGGFDPMMIFSQIGGL